MPNLNDTTYIDILPKTLGTAVLVFKLNFKELKEKKKDLNKYGLDITEWLRLEGASGRTACPSSLFKSRFI